MTKRRTDLPKFVAQNKSGKFIAQVNRADIRFSVYGFKTAVKAHGYAVTRLIAEGYPVKPESPGERDRRRVKGFRETAEAQRERLRGLASRVWECIGCGAEYEPVAPSKCSKCNGYSFESTLVYRNSKEAV